MTQNARNSRGRSPGQLSHALLLTGAVVGAVFVVISISFLHLGAAFVTAARVLMILGLFALTGLALISARLLFRARTTEDLLTMAFRASEDGLWDYNIQTGAVEFNEQWFTMLDYEADEMPHTFETWTSLLHPEDRDTAVARVERAINEGDSRFEISFRMKTKDGSWKWILSRGRVVEWDGRGRGARMVGVHSDVNRLKRAESDLVHLAYHDQLTGLPNRKGFYEEAQRTLQQSSREPTAIRAFLILDLDNFKDVNDSFGHETGDELLKQCASRLQSALRQTDHLFRLGGDEFIIILNQLKQATDAALVAANLVQAFTEPFFLGEHTAFVGVSIGIAIHPRDGKDASELMQRADAAMYDAKAEKNSYRFYTKRMQTEARKRMQLKSELQSALDTDELAVCYQPISTATGQVVAVEALLRWNHPSGVRSPPDFLHAAQDAGMVMRLGRWVMLQAAIDAANWNARQLGINQVTVNLTANHMRSKSITDDIELALAASDLAPECLELELTEDTFLDATQKTLELLMEVRQKGVRFAIDDFGTGYSSFSYLKKLPVSTVKIDSSFIEGLPFSKQDAAIVRSVITMSHGLGMAVVAEGVERAEQVAFLKRLECDFYQGFYFAKPMTAAEITEYAHVRNHVREVAAE